MWGGRPIVDLGTGWAYGLDGPSKRVLIDSQAGVCSFGHGRIMFFDWWV